MLCIFVPAFGQFSMELSFSALNNLDYIQIDSVKIMNKSQGSDTVLYYPDTLLMLNYTVATAESDPEKNDLRLMPFFPNPVTGKALIRVFVPERGLVDLTVSNITGSTICREVSVKERGIHNFRFDPAGSGLYVVRVCHDNTCLSGKLIQSAKGLHGPNTLVYQGMESEIMPWTKSADNTSDFNYTIGDILLIIGYSGGLQSGIVHSPTADHAYILQFATGIPCPGIPSVFYENKTYNTIQIYGQCWLKENLNAGTMISGGQDQTNNGILEKYCPQNDEDSCTIYGAFYQWDEMMQYTTLQGGQGICPPGFHVPVDEEWNVLAGAVDSQYRIGNPLWNTTGPRGFDAGIKLKTTTGWQSGGNGSNTFIFTGIPAGYRSTFGSFGGKGLQAFFWSSDQSGTSSAWDHYLYYNGNGICRESYLSRKYGLSVRCLKNE